MALSDHYKSGAKIPSPSSSEVFLSVTPNVLNETSSNSSKDDSQPLKVKQQSNLILLKQIEETMEESTPYHTSKAGFHASPVPKKPKGELQHRKGSQSNNQ
jgi:hypothetical protein